MRRHFFSIDWWIVGPMVVLLVMGLTTLLSLNGSLFVLQLFYALLGLICFFIFANLPSELLMRLAKPIYFFSLGILALVLLLGIESHGAVRWIGAFGRTIQFSEICKPLLVFALAGFLSKHENTQPAYVFILLLLLFPLVLFIYLQPDLGDAIIYLLVTLFVLFVYGYQLRWFAISLLPFFVVLPFLWFHLREYQQTRILTFLHPTSDQSGASYNAIQAIIAVGSGLFWGRGLSEGTQSGLRFLPERHTDFIFASLTEELGFIGGMIVLLAFAILLYRMYYLFQHSQDAYAKLCLAGAFGLLLLHVFLNIGMNIGLVPIVGVTLPFVSFGGSSLLANCILLGVTAGISKTLRSQNVLEIS